MSVTKRMWIERDPEFQAQRDKAAPNFSELEKEFPFRMPASKLKTANGRKRRDAFWPWAIEKAIRETGAASIQINGGVFFRTEEERDLVKSLAERYFTEKPGLSPQRTVEEYRRARKEARVRR